MMAPCPPRFILAPPLKPIRRLLHRHQLTQTTLGMEPDLHGIHHLDLARGRHRSARGGS
jgi:hypothetical protein